MRIYYRTRSANAKGCNGFAASRATASSAMPADVDASDHACLIGGGLSRDANELGRNFKG